MIAVRFVALFGGGLAAGITLCILLVDRAPGGSARFYTELAQRRILALTVPAPALGLLSLAAMSIDAVVLFQRGGGMACSLEVVAIILSVAAAVVTKVGHFPINDRIRGWNPVSPPTDWAETRAKWSALHLARTTAAVGSFALLVLSNSTK